MEDIFVKDEWPARNADVPSMEKGARKKRGRPPKGSPAAVRTHRFQITLSEKGYQRLTALQNATDAVSAADVVRDALRVYEALIDEAATGRHVLLEDPEDSDYRVRLKLW